MIITKKAISRRALLRGVGAAIALPLLDGMVPAFASGLAKPTRRLGVVYVPMGVAMHDWTPTVEGGAFELTRILKPLEPFRDRMLVLSRLDSDPALARAGEPGAGHARTPPAFTTATHAKATEGADVEAGISIDQIAAAAFGQDTQLASLELGLESADFAGSCDIGYSCIYSTTLAWRNPTTPLPVEHNPRAVFERLFGDDPNTDRATRLARLRKDRSVLDVLREDVARLQRDVGAADRVKLSDYLEAIRDVERRIQKAEEQSDRELPTLERPGGVPETFEEHAKLMFDLQVLAYQADLTRVITFMVGKELSSRTYPQIGVREGHHVVSHHQHNPETLEMQAKINLLQTTLLAYYLTKLEATADGEGSLLDHMMILYGSGMSNSQAHDPLNLPVLLLGGGSGRIKGGRHLRYAKGTPLANLHLAMLARLGLGRDSFGNSTGELHL